jgi:hypothetical protein
MRQQRWRIRPGGARLIVSIGLVRVAGLPDGRFGPQTAAVPQPSAIHT